jgi:hypothetical protein
MNWITAQTMREGERNSSHLNADPGTRRRHGMRFIEFHH